MAVVTQDKYRGPDEPSGSGEPPTGGSWRFEPAEPSLTAAALPRAQLRPDHEQLINEWVDRAHPYTTVEANGEPEGFVGLCPPARGAITFADTEQEAIDDMRSCLFGWAYFSLGDGQGLPTLPGDTATR